ncbi:MAG: hypothetical protein ACD_54C01273G0003 [uncultured bacterium]|uniref:DUF1294 domain-containing protein n=1 Tax=Cypionkella sp. TaxID=2811411 RepID=UPI000285C3FF|nr:DUF1294 domain-containing protein [Cypionkella sp.]EKD59567.1 MAG: hypothetical protein ACD_54C01273G0003 [uncultured bacterium]KAF0176178.1 MAG: hypothetical protein FD162_187 [Paracoccaceae bacterium]MDO8328652.1 DUF1294 domain-containing protein [Cypionkella sp.]
MDIAAFFTDPARLLALSALGYIIVVSTLTYLVFANDKRRAELGDRRVPEATLLLLAGLGGWPGAKLAQLRLRHKTRKRPFRLLLNLCGLLLPLWVGLALAQDVAWAALADQATTSVQGFLADAGGGSTDKPALPRRFGPGSSE